MNATVLALSDHRAVFILPEVAGTVVFLASRGPTPRIGHERRFDDLDTAMVYARSLTARFECAIVGPAAVSLTEGAA